MQSLLNFHFIRPGWLLLIPVLVVVWFFWQRRTDPLQGWREQIDPELLKALVVGNTRTRSRSAWLVLLGWILAAIAVSGPTWKREPSPFAADAAPLIILLKADGTMDEDGVTPTPLERGQLKISDLAQLRKGQPLGLIAYAGSAHLVLPPTRDTTVVSQMASEISSDVMPQAGDRLDRAIAKGGEVLSSNKTGGSLLVIANSVEGDLKSLASAHQAAGGYSIQFLALGDDSTIESAADELSAKVVSVTPTDDDVQAITKGAERNAVVGLGGDSERWQEAGYWLVPLLAVLVLSRFRRDSRRDGKDAS